METIYDLIIQKFFKGMSIPLIEEGNNIYLDSQRLILEVKK